MQILDKSNFSIGLTPTVTGQTVFGVSLLLVDHADVPIDRRYRITTRADKATDFTAATEHLAWLTTLWGQQNGSPATAYVGRWVSAASSPYCYFPAATSLLSAYTSVSDFYLNITDNDTVPNEDEVGPIDATSGVTTMADLCAKIETALQAIAVPNITGLDTATCALDKLGRIAITNSTTGAAALTITTAAASTGTDLAGVLYWGAGVIQAGLDVEALGTALAAIVALTNVPFAITERGASIAQAVAFSTAVNSLDKICEIVVADTDAKDSGASSDIAYQVQALGHQKTHMTYTEHHTDNGAASNDYSHADAAVLGEVLPRTNGEGRHKWNDNAMTSVYESGLDADLTTIRPLTAGERAALEAKGCDYLATIGGSTVLVNGLAAGGNEMRVMLGKAFMAARINEAVWSYSLANDMAFDDEDILAIKGIIEYWYGVMVDRRLLRAGATVTMPSAADFTSAVMATHTMTLTDILNATVQPAVNNVIGTINFSV